jgi:excisionase family DNA binding protein
VRRVMTMSEKGRRGRRPLMKPVGEGRGLLTTDEVAEHLGVTRRTVQNWIKTGELACYQFGEGKGITYRIDPKDGEAFLKKHRRGGEP